jgi:hypothetical protein
VLLSQHVIKQVVNTAELNVYERVSSEHPSNGVRIQGYRDSKVPLKGCSSLEWIDWKVVFVQSVGKRDWSNSSLHLDGYYMGKILLSRGKQLPLYPIKCSPL